MKELSNVTPSMRTESTNGMSTPAIVRWGMAEALVRSLAPVPNTMALVLLGFKIRPLERNHLTTWSAHFESVLTTLSSTYITVHDVSKLALPHSRANLETSCTVVYVQLQDHISCIALYHYPLKLLKWVICQEVCT